LMLRRIAWANCGGETGICESFAAESVDVGEAAISLRRGARVIIITCVRVHAGSEWTGGHRLPSSV
jgi:hypothetical protein